MAKLLFAIPAFNEATTVGDLIHDLLPHGDVLLVDDGSLDGTGAIAQAAGAMLVRHPKNLGYDTAINTCLTEGRTLPYDWIVTVDADGQHQISDLERFKPHFSDKDLIVGIRPTASRRFGEHMLGLYYRMKYGLNDPLSGFKAYRTLALRNLQFRSVYQSTSYGLNALDEMLTTNPRIAQVPIKIRKRIDNARIGNSWHVNRRMLACFWERLLR